MNEISDVDTACNLLKSMRKYRRNSFYKKSITVPLFKENGRVVSSKIVVDFNKNTSHISFSFFGIRFNRCDIYPTTRKKLSCKDGSALSMLKKIRVTTHKIETCSKYFGMRVDDVYLREKITYNIINDTVHYWCGFGNHTYDA